MRKLQHCAGRGGKSDGADAERALDEEPFEGVEHTDFSSL